MPADRFRSRLRPGDLLAAATVGLRARKLRAVLSGLAVAVGIAAVVSVLGITRSSESALLAEIDRIGTNLLTVTNRQDLSGQEVELPAQAGGMIGRAADVLHAAATADLPSFAIYRTEVMPGYATNGLDLRASDDSLLVTLDGAIRQGTYLNAATSRYPAAVLGYQAATALGIASLPARIWVSDPGGVTGHWLSVVGILDPVPLAPEIDGSVLVGFPAARQMFGYDGHPSRIYVRTVTSQTARTAALLGPTAWPDHPEQVQVSRPPDALTARIAVQDADHSVPRPRRHRHLGRRPRHRQRDGHLRARAPASIWGGIALAVGVGAVAGCYPALRAARLSPTDALRSA